MEDLIAAIWELQAYIKAKSSRARKGRSPSSIDDDHSRRNESLSRGDEGSVGGQPGKEAKKGAYPEKMEADQEVLKAKIETSHEELMAIMKAS
jgi:hypothetical protein